MLPRLTSDLVGAGGVLHSHAEDFRVTELLPFSPNGSGPHLFVELQKTNLDTPQAIRNLLQLWGQNCQGPLPLEIGYAGLKDRHAIARQWVSLPWSGSIPEAREGLGVQVLQAVFHSEKLRRGQQSGNQFEIRIRQVPEGGFERAQAILAALTQRGVPNYFGPQRFGIHSDNASRARAILRGEQRPPRDRRLTTLLFSALQAEIFNQVLAQRIASGTLGTALLGDLVQKHDTGGMFWIEDLAADQPRIDALAISPTGPMPGKKMRAPRDPAGAIERAIIQAAGVDPNDMPRLGPGTRRVLRYPLGPHSLVPEGSDSFWIRFTLPSGAYATVVLDELIKPASGPFDRLHATDSEPSEPQSLELQSSEPES